MQECSNTCLYSDKQPIWETIICHRMGSNVCLWKWQLTSHSKLCILISRATGSLQCWTVKVAIWPMSHKNNTSQVFRTCTIHTMAVFQVVGDMAGLKKHNVFPTGNGRRWISSVMSREFNHMTQKWQGQYILSIYNMFKNTV